MQLLRICFILSLEIPVSWKQQYFFIYKEMESLNFKKLSKDTQLVSGIQELAVHTT